ncbi:hypothetical protein [Bacillus sp. B15-48]|uniref:hypothetical protein n=1 Tax=Bacillus sp. B15-48 TaxID=1548601 RepID=UPI00193F2F21|nr:hypothetical protein [Bacillus sp. B15-48]MBM4761889.1 hypothetical protein [Bacillus sp. B15-48]
MKLNERGSSLVLVLLVILVFSVLGLSLLVNTVGETKRTVKTESNSQAQQYALDGLTYFETAFKNYVHSTDSNSINLLHFLADYEDWVTVGPEIEPVKIQVKAQLIGLEDQYNIEVTSKGVTSDTKKTIIGYYMLKYDFEHDEAVYKIIDLTKDGAYPLNFTNDNVLKLGVGAVLNLNLITIGGSEKNYHRVPDEQRLLNINLLNLISIGGGNGDFSMYKEKPIIASRQGAILGVDLLKLVKVNVLNEEVVANTNVVIDGGYSEPVFSLLGIRIGQKESFKNIEFKKLIVIGNVVIQQDKVDRGLFYNDRIDQANPRYFTFNEGLFVYRSLEVGGKQTSSSNPPISNLMLRGDMVTMENLYINHVNLTIGDSDHKNLSTEDKFSNIYVHGNAEIKNACINLKNNDYRFGLFVAGKLTIENNSSCSTFPGIYYAEGGIEIKTNNQPMTINGGLIGELTVDYPDRLTINWDEQYLPKIKVKNIDLIPQGRIVD